MPPRDESARALGGLVRDDPVKGAALEVQSPPRAPNTPFTSAECPEVLCCLWDNVRVQNDLDAAGGPAVDFDVQEDLGLAHRSLGVVLRCAARVLAALPWLLRRASPSERATTRAPSRAPRRSYTAPPRALAAGSDAEPPSTGQVRLQAGRSERDRPSGAGGITILRSLRAGWEGGSPDTAGRAWRVLVVAEEVHRRVQVPHARSRRRPTLDGSTARARLAAVNGAGCRESSPSLSLLTRPSMDSWVVSRWSWWAAAAFLLATFAEVAQPVDAGRRAKLLRNTHHHWVAQCNEHGLSYCHMANLEELPNNQLGVSFQGAPVIEVCFGRSSRARREAC
eukprot:scaffold1541_cov418-Prasinococcus_capsulatus_cf.AAC.21